MRGYTERKNQRLISLDTSGQHRPNLSRTPCGERADALCKSQNRIMCRAAIRVETWTATSLPTWLNACLAFWPLRGCQQHAGDTMTRFHGGSAICHVAESRWCGSVFLVLSLVTGAVRQADSHGFCRCIDELRIASCPPWPST